MPIPASTSPRASLWEWAQTLLLAANLVWTTLLRGGFPAQARVVTSTLTVVLLMVHFLGRAFARGEVDGNLRAPPEPKTNSDGARRSPSTSLRPHLAGWFFIPFLVYAAANVIWISPVPWLGWREWFGWAEIVAVFWVVLNGIRSSAPQRGLFLVLALLGVVGVLLACYQVFVNPEWQMLGGERTWYHGRASGSFGMPNSFAAFLLLMLPAAAALSLRRSASATQRVWWGWVTLVLALGFALTNSRGAWLALLGALTVWPLWVIRGRWVRRVGVALLVFAAIALVGILIAAKSPSMRARFVQLSLDAGERTRPIMWRAAWNLFRERPLAGTGAASYDVRFEKYRPEGFNDEPLYAHNDYLNTLSDYGLVGFALLFGAGAAVAVAAIRIRRDDQVRRRDGFDSPAVRSALAIGLLAFALQLGLEFHLKIPALGLAIATLAGVAVSRIWPSGARARAAGTGRRVGLAVLALGGAAGFVVFFLPQFRAESFRQNARDAIDALARMPTDAAHYRAPLEQARAALQRAIALDPGNGQAWADLAYATALWTTVEPGHDAEYGRMAEAAAERALDRSRACHEFWIRRGVARDLQGRWAEAGDDFALAVKMAPANSRAWYYYAEHLSRVYAVRESADGAAAFCLRLDPGNALALALRQRLAIKPKAP